MRGYAELRQEIWQSNTPYLLMFGTGWGLTDETIAEADCVLRPVYGAGSYNHLSVRSAVSIILDRLFGEGGAKFAQKF